MVTVGNSGEGGEGVDGGWSCKIRINRCLRLCLASISNIQLAQ